MTTIPRPDLAITDRFDQLFQRAMSDDGPEGTVALKLLVQLAKKHEGRAFFIPTSREGSSPYYMLVQSREAQIAQLQAQLADVTKRAETLQRSLTRFIKAATPSGRVF
jgi:hypothetical protein